MERTTDLDPARVTIRVPDHVVWRAFAGDTVALNLETGRYYGLNGVAGEMLEALRERGDVRAVSEALAARYDVAREVIEADLVELCHELAERGLVHIDARS